MAKSQTALEYLMVYSWAIVIIIIVVGVLFYYFILTKPCLLAGTQVKGFANFKVENVKLTTNVLSFDLSYFESSNAELQKIIVSGDANSTGNSPVGIILSSIKVRVWAYTTTEKTIENCYDINVEIKYKISETIFTSSGKISGMIERSSGIVSQTICQNAADAELCEGLDIVYGEGYGDLCCSEYSLCC